MGRIHTLMMCMVAGAMACGFAAAMARADGVAVTLPDPAAPVAIPGSLEFSGRIIAKPWPIATLVARGLTPEAAQAQDQRARDRLASTLLQAVSATDELIVSVAQGRTDATLVAELAATGDYQYVQPDWLCFPAQSPNDPFLASQYYHERLQSRLAWGITTGSSSIICAVADTGVDLTHPDLAGHFVSGFNSPDNLAQSAGGQVQDLNGHGTLVAGLIGATGNNGIGVSGMGWNLSIMPVRVSNFENGSALTSQITAGARWAADHGARVVNVSYSGVTNPTIQSTGAYIKNTGGLLCWAAGNNGSLLTPTADWPDVIIVGSVDSADVRAPSSNFGVPIDCVAPGVDTFSTARGGGYEPNSGTSFATPLVVGTLGLIFSANPGYTPDQAQGLLFAGCEDLGAFGEDAFYGAGRINAYRSLWIATHGSTPIPGPDACIAPAGTPVVIDVLANDFDAQAESLSIVGFDDTSTLGGSVTRSIGTGPGGRDQLIFTGAGIGSDSFEYTISSGIAISTVTVSPRVLNPAALRQGGLVTGAGDGLAASFYSLEVPPALQLPDFSALTPVTTSVWIEINFPLTSIEFPGTLMQDNLGAVAIGFLRVPADGFYTLTLESDEGSKLFVGGALVVDNDGMHPMRATSGVIGLHAGSHPLRIEFFERAGDCGLIARIAGPGIPERILGGTFLSQTSEVPLDINQDGSVDPDDLGDFINLYFSQDPRADVDGNGVLDPDDLGDYINAYFAH